MSDPSDEPGTPTSSPAPPPIDLTYFAPEIAPIDAARQRKVTLFTVLLIIGWLPYGCGLLNVAVASAAFSRSVIQSHSSGAIVFLLAGMGLSIAGFVGFLRLRHLIGCIAAGAVLLVQAGVVGCVRPW